MAFYEIVHVRLNYLYGNRCAILLNRHSTNYVHNYTKVGWCIPCEQLSLISTVWFRTLDTGARQCLIEIARRSVLLVSSFGSNMDDIDAAMDAALKALMVLRIMFLKQTRLS